MRFERRPGVFVPAAIVPVDRARGIRHPAEDGDVVRQDLEFQFAFPAVIFGFLADSNVDERDDRPVDHIIHGAIRADAHDEGGAVFADLHLMFDDGQFAQDGPDIALKIGVAEQGDDLGDRPTTIGVARVESSALKTRTSERSMKCG